MRKNKIENIQALRGVAALLVFAAHLKGAELDYGGGGELLPFALNMGVAGVAWATVIASYLAAGLGIWLALAWPVGLAACATWAAAAAIFRISSLSALVSAASSVIWALLFGYVHAVILALVLGALVFWRHHSNIARLFAGTEPRIGAK